MLGLFVAAQFLPVLGSTAFLATTDATLQLVSEERFRGRVMALWSVTYIGSTPIGGPIVGAVSEQLGPRAGLLLGAGACLAAAGIGLSALFHVPKRHRLLERRPPAVHPLTVTEADRT